jgi:hypothetical protein
MFTPNELNYLYQVLDQLNVRGEDQKAMVLNLMRKVRAALEPPRPENPVPEVDPAAMP